MMVALLSGIALGVVGTAIVVRKRARAVASPPQIPSYKPLPADFKFGVATADHQCEAFNPNVPDVRDVFDLEGGLTLRGMATDFRNRYREDVELARKLGCRIFRISLAWSQLEPEVGVWSREQFAYYRDLLTYIKSCNMETVVTLLHCTWPIHVQNNGGLVDESFPALFEEYAARVALELGDLIDYYVTINEPNMLIFGYLKPWWTSRYATAPGLPLNAGGEVQVENIYKLIPNLFCAHARAYEAIHSCRPQAKVGTNPLMLGFPRLLQRFFNWNASRLGGPETLQRQLRRFTEHRYRELGKADIVLAQLTMTPEREDEMMFTESYFQTQLATLSTARFANATALFAGAVAVVRSSVAEADVPGRYPRATPVPVEDSSSAVALLRRGRVDLVLGDEIALRQFADSRFQLTLLDGLPHAYAIGIAPGDWETLNAIDAAVRDFKFAGSAGPSPWERAYRRIDDVCGPVRVPSIGSRANNAEPWTVRPDPQRFSQANLPPVARRSVLSRIHRSRSLRVAVRSGIAGFCERSNTNEYTGFEPDLARHIASYIPGNPTVEFIEVPANGRMQVVRQFPFQAVAGVLRAIAVLSTLASSNWWYLGWSGKLSQDLFPPKCADFANLPMDYVGIDYYWGIKSLRFGRLRHLYAEIQRHFASAPVWPAVLYGILSGHAKMFSQKPILVIENGCVDEADRNTRDIYLRRHVAEVQRAVADGVPVEAYLCWSITSNREWGLPFDKNSDFGLYHIALDTDPSLTRCETSSVLAYESIVKKGDANA
jgi:beta-glucosidase/6-phospho-beta-glucosidase/beta-galactosidase/ABC-type amino acid transport substrate-binding protein